jgi:SpoVK/Ycf46/Vps4 family AAA+-type ATPase
MPTIDQLSRLFKAVSNGDLHGAEHVAIEIASNEEKKGHRTAAQLLKGSLVANGTKSLVDGQRRGSGNVSSAILMSALSARSAAVALEDVYLRKAARSQLQEVVEEFQNKERLTSLGIRSRTKLILHGPPGCGKSLAAQALANELELALFVVRFDSIIGAYLGQTATHLRQLFQYAENNQCVLLFDEIDALGKRRGSPSDVGELDRIVIALMQELELSELQGLVIATSNIPDSLDPALWRRFDLSINFPRPNKAELLRFTRSKARSFHLPMSAGLVRRISLLTSYSEAEKAIEDTARRIAMKGL